MNDSSASCFPAADIHEKQQTLPFHPELRHNFNLCKIRGSRYILLRFGMPDAVSLCKAATARQHNIQPDKLITSEK